MTRNAPLLSIVAKGPIGQDTPCQCAKHRADGIFARAMKDDTGAETHAGANYHRKRRQHSSPGNQTGIVAIEKQRHSGCRDKCCASKRPSERYAERAAVQDRAEPQPIGQHRCRTDYIRDGAPDHAAVIALRRGPAHAC